MKYLKNVIVIFFSLLLFTACNQEEDVLKGNESQSISIKLNIPSSANAVTRAGSTSASNAERTIGNVYILIYENSESKNEAVPVFFHSETEITKTTGIWEKTFVKSLMNLEKGNIYKIFVLANMPKNESGEVINAPTKTTNMADLSVLIESLSSSKQQNGSDISFSASQELTYTENETSISIELIRTVARLNVSITKDADISDWTIESVSLGNENTGVKYFTANAEEPSNTGSRKTAQTLLWNDGIQDGKANYHYYPYENEQSTEASDQLHLTMILKDEKNVTHTFETVVNSKGNSQLKRDYIYTMEITLKDTPIDPVTVMCNVIQWKEAEYPTHIGGKVTYLDIPDIVDFTSAGEGVLPIKTDAENVKIILNKDASRVYFEDDTEVREMSFAIDNTNNRLANLRMNDLTTEAYEETMIVEAGHLSKTVKCVRKENLLAFSVTVKDDANENLEFPWDFGMSTTGEINDSIYIKITRNVDACYIIRAYMYIPGDEFPRELDPIKVELPLVERNMVDEIKFKFSEDPYYVTENTNPYPVYVEIKVCLFYLEFPYVYKTLKYTLLPKSN